MTDWTLFEDGAVTESKGGEECPWCEGLIRRNDIVVVFKAEPYHEDCWDEKEAEMHYERRS